MYDPSTMVKCFKWLFTETPLLTVWHVDPETDGSDDSCDWFGGKKLTTNQKKTRDRIAQRFEHKWNRESPYEWCGWFMPKGAVNGKWCDGEPNYSTHALVLSMFRIAANEHFGHWSKRADDFLRHNIFDILFFAENSCDSLCEAIEQKCGVSESSVKNQAYQMASTVYGWILRAERPWWRHPRWHFWHWRFQFHPWQNFVRRWWTKCAVCGKRGFKEAAIGSWNGDKVWHQSCDHVFRVGRREGEE